MRKWKPRISIPPRFVIRWMNQSLLRPANSPFLSAFFVSKAQIPPSKAARFRLVYSLRRLMRVRNLKLSIKSASFDRRTDSRCRRFPSCIHTAFLYYQLSCLLILPGKKGPNRQIQVYVQNGQFANVAPFSLLVANLISILKKNLRSRFHQLNNICKFPMRKECL